MYCINVDVFTGKLCDSKHTVLSSNIPLVYLFLWHSLQLLSCRRCQEKNCPWNKEINGPIISLPKMNTANPFHALPTKENYSTAIHQWNTDIPQFHVTWLFVLQSFLVLVYLYLHYFLCCIHQNHRHLCHHRHHRPQMACKKSIKMTHYMRLNEPSPCQWAM